MERHRTASTVITSNREPPEILTMMADQSAMDRLQSAAYELVVEGESYRQRQKPRPSKTGQFGPAELTSSQVISHHHPTASNRK